MVDAEILLYIGHSILPMMHPILELKVRADQEVVCSSTPGAHDLSWDPSPTSLATVRRVWDLIA